MQVLAAVLVAAQLAAGEGAAQQNEQLVQAGSRAFQTSLSTLWRGSDDLRFKTTYAGGTVLDGFICSDLKHQLESHSYQFEESRSRMLDDYGNLRRRMEYLTRRFGDGDISSSSSSRDDGCMRFELFSNSDEALSGVTTPRGDPRTEAVVYIQSWFRRRLYAELQASLGVCRHMASLPSASQGTFLTRAATFFGTCPQAFLDRLDKLKGICLDLTDEAA